jgi:hypothetical protein
MVDQEPTERMILLRIVEILGQSMLREDRDPTDNAAGHFGNVVNNIISSSPNLSFVASREAVLMSDSYTTGQAGAVGPHSSARDISFNQVWNQVGSAIDLPGLAQELAKVRSEMRRTAEGGPEQDLALAEVAKAEISAKSDDGPTVMQHLRKAGMWALDAARSVGAELAATVIAKAMGL